MAVETKLNLGSGSCPLPGYLNIDRKHGSEAYPLAGIEDGSVDEVRASHLLEHFARYELLPVLAEWKRVLRPGGIIRISVPDFDKIIQMRTRVEAAVVDGIKPAKQDEYWFAYLMGGQTDENDFHKTVWTKEILAFILMEAGFTDLRYWLGDARDTSSHCVSLNIQGTKPHG